MAIKFQWSGFHESSTCKKINLSYTCKVNRMKKLLIIFWIFWLLNETTAGHFHMGRIGYVKKIAADDLKLLKLMDLGIATINQATWERHWK